MGKIIFGCMRINNKSYEEIEELLLDAIKNDILIFDHADIYGQRECEKIFGKFLAKYPHLREKIIIQSKCGICKKYYDLSKEHIIESVLESIRLLNCDYLDVLLLHRPDILVDYKEVNEAFNYLYDYNLVKHFGVSNMNHYQIDLYNKYLDHKIEYNQVQLSIVHSLMVSQSLFVNMEEEESISHSSGMLEYSLLNNIKLQSWSPLMASWEDGCFIDNPKYENLNKELALLAEKYNVSKSAIALAWINKLPHNVDIVIGTTNLIHLKELLDYNKINLTKKEWYSLYLACGHILP